MHLVSSEMLMVLHIWVHQIRSVSQMVQAKLACQLKATKQENETTAENKYNNQENKHERKTRTTSNINENTALGPRNKKRKTAKTQIEKWRGKTDKQNHKTYQKQKEN